MQNPLVSIIIPTYNRYHLIGETLDSVLAQTYTNWECIVVDDGSTDETDSLLGEYCVKDGRFQYHHRPSNRVKGANACRNYGFEISKGEFVNWFDSDDLMDKDFIKVKVLKIKATNSDFVFSKTLNFDNNDNQSQIFDIDNKGEIINPFNFIKQSITWCTLDFLAKKNTLENIKFNETLESGQEYNFFSRYLYLSTNGIFIDYVLAKRRVHENSIQSQINIEKKIFKSYYWKNIVVNRFFLLKDIKRYNDDTSEVWLINSIILFCFYLASDRVKIPRLMGIIMNVLEIKGVNSLFFFLLSLVGGYTTKRGYNFMLKAKL